VRAPGLTALAEFLGERVCCSLRRREARKLDVDAVRTAALTAIMEGLCFGKAYYSLLAALGSERGSVDATFRVVSAIRVEGDYDLWGYLRTLAGTMPGLLSALEEETVKRVEGESEAESESD
jgi:hypothetical protein